jgi:hypothetical protein
VRILTSSAARSAALLASLALGVVAPSVAMAVVGGNANETGSNTGATGVATPGNANSARTDPHSGTGATGAGAVGNDTQQGASNKGTESGVEGKGKPQ